MPFRCRRLVLILLPLSLFLVLCESSSALTLLETNAKVVDSNHVQVQTAGGDADHLVRVVTLLPSVHSAIDADVLLADGQPLSMTWRRDADDSDLVDLSLAFVLDYEPCHLQVSVRAPDGEPAIFHSIGDVVTNGTAVALSPSAVSVYFPLGIEALENVYLGDVESGASLRSAGFAPWLVDLSALGAGDEFEIVLRAGPPADGDEDREVNLADYEIFNACLEMDDLTHDCRVLFDLDANESVDLADFALFQTFFYRNYSCQPPQPPVEVD